MSMIFEPVVEAINTVTVLTGVYPAGHIIDAESTPFVCYSFGQRDAERDLRGEVHHYTDHVQIVIFSDTYDETWEIEEELEGIFNDWIQTDWDDLRIFRAEVSIIGDTVQSGLDLITRTMSVEIDWTRIEE